MREVKSIDYRISGFCSSTLGGYYEPILTYATLFSFLAKLLMSVFSISLWLFVVARFDLELVLAIPLLNLLPDCFILNMKIVTSPFLFLF